MLIKQEISSITQMVKACIEQVERAFDKIKKLERQRELSVKRRFSLVLGVFFFYKIEVIDVNQEPVAIQKVFGM